MTEDYFGSAEEDASLDRIVETAAVGGRATLGLYVMSGVVAIAVEKHCLEPHGRKFTDPMEKFLDGFWWKISH